MRGKDLQQTQNLLIFSFPVVSSVTQTTLIEYLKYKWIDSKVQLNLS